MRSLFDDVDGLDATKMLAISIEVPVGREYKEVLGIVSDIPFQSLFRLLLKPATKGGEPIYIIEMIIEDESSVVLTSKMHEVVKSEVKDNLIPLIPKLIESAGFNVVEKALIVNLTHKLKEAGVSQITQIGFEAVFERNNIWWIRYIGPNGKVVSESSESTNPEKAQALLVQRKQDIIKKIIKERST